MESKIIQGDCLEIMRRFPDESIDMCLTSPPYWGLRDYGLGKDQLGLEPTPKLYIKHMTAIFHEVKRVLKKEGIFWLNIGDTYGGSLQGYGAKKRSDSGLQEIAGKKGRFTKSKPPMANLMSKCLLMVPERLAWSLIQDGWILRNKIIWYKPNAMPASVKDRFNNRWEYVFLFSKSKKYYFDLNAVREPHHWSSHGRYKRKYTGTFAKEKTTCIGYKEADSSRELNPFGKNPGDIWIINTVSCPVKGVHFATFPEELCRKAIIPGCPDQICKKCGKARRRIVEEKRGEATNSLSINVKQGNLRKGGEFYRPIIESKTIGWTSCKCNAGFEGGIVLDPFAGVGTAGRVAKMLGRKYIMIDIKKEYCDAAEKEIKKVGYQKSLF